MKYFFKFNKMLSPVERKMSMASEYSNEDYKETIKFVSLKHCNVHKTDDEGSNLSE